MPGRDMHSTECSLQDTFEIN
uniref:Uncharacterized protein n=1 Tax=Anguilla anguilla TaxID=7936 RepID=A0A0E9UWG7_ANGAN